MGTTFESYDLDMGFWDEAPEGDDDNYDDLGEILEEILDTESRVEQGGVQTGQKKVEGFTMDTIGYHPKYVMYNIRRGESYDTFYHQPLYDRMVTNEQVINVINSGSEAQIVSLPNFITQTPGTKGKCDQSLECKFFTDVTLALMMKYNVTNVSDVYKRIALLSDRMCGGCERESSKVACLCGKWRCRNCEKKGKDISFLDGLEEWLTRGSPTRHAESVLQ